MAEFFEKLDDEALDTVSGGIKYNIGSTPVPVYDSNRNNFRTLYAQRGDYFVTDGSYKIVNGVAYAHVFLDHGDGYIDARFL